MQFGESTRWILSLFLACIKAACLLAAACGVSRAGDTNEEVPITIQQSPATKQVLDRVIIRQAVTNNTKLSHWKPPRQTVLEGRITEMDSGGLTIQTVSDSDSHPISPTRVPSGQILKVSPVWKGSGTAGVVQLFEQSKYADFVQMLREKDRSEIPRWQQLLLLEMIVRAVTEVQGPASSGQHFLTLSDSVPEAFFAEMPLCWAVVEPSVELVRKSHEWIDSKNDVAQLLGASWLLNGPESQKARDTIVRLRQSSNPAISQLAVAQSWRLVAPPDTMRVLPEWLAFRDRMLPPLALGPTEFLADRLARIGETDLAIGQWMWIATTLPERHNRVQRALRAAENLLRSSEHNEEATRITGWLKNLHGSSE